MSSTSTTPPPPTMDEQPNETPTSPMDLDLNFPLPPIPPQSIDLNQPIEIIDIGSDSSSISISLDGDLMPLSHALHLFTNQQPLQTLDLMEEKNFAVIGLDEPWLTTLKKRVHEVTHPKHIRVEPRTIFRVPDNLRQADPNAYEPKIISFGPYHRNKPAVKRMDDLKFQYVRRILRRNTNVTIEDYLGSIKTMEARARNSYSEEIAMESNEFVEMMLLDGCFIVQLFLMQLDSGEDEEDKTDEQQKDAEEDPIVDTTWTLVSVMFDMLMLENQIPFFIVSTIFDFAAAEHPNKDNCSLINLMYLFFRDIFPGDHMTVPAEEVVPRFYHLLHFLHSCIIPSERRNVSSSRIKPHKPSIYHKLDRIRRILSRFFGRLMSSVSVYKKGASYSPVIPGMIPNAKQLEEAGVKFKKKQAKSFLDVTFQDGTMEIPPLRVYDEANSFFRNLIAFEQCYPDSGTYVAAYAVFMDCLVDTKDDVALLHHYGCIVNGLGTDEDAVKLFSRLCKEVASDYESCHLADIYKEVKKHRDSRYARWRAKHRKWRAKLMNDYFSNPWSALSLLGALVVILLTIVQTVFAVLAYFRPP